MLSIHLEPMRCQLDKVVSGGEGGRMALEIEGIGEGAAAVEAIGARGADMGD